MNFRLTNISSLQLFQLLRYATYVLIGVVFAKTGLSVSDIGSYEQFLFLSGAVSFFWLNGLVRGMLPLANERKNEPGKIIFSVFILVSVFTLLAILLLVVINGVSVERSFFKGQINFLPLMLAYLFFSVPANLIEYFFLIKNESRKIIQYGIINFIFLFVMVVVPAIMGLSILNCLYGLLISAFARYLFLLFLLLKHAELRVSYPFIKEHLFLAFPLIVSALLSGSAQYVDGFIVTSRFNEAAFAVFRFGARELPLVMLLANAFSAAILPEFSQKENLQSLLAKIKRESFRMAHYFFPLSAILLAASHYFFPIVFNADFEESATIFNIYLLLISSRLLFPQTILIGLKKTSLIAWASFLELVLNVSLSLWLVSIWGIKGVAFATVIAYLFEKGFLIFEVKRRLNIRVTNYQNIFWHLIYSLLLFFIFYIVEFVIY